jgi:hypothetical protein
MLTQDIIDKRIKKLKNSINDTDTFLKNNYKILKKKSTNTKLEIIFMKNLEKNNLVYQSPEAIELFLDTLCFYMVLEEFGIPCDEW